MSATVEVRHHYPVSAERLWALTMDLPSLAEMNAPLVAFGSLPDGRMHEGLVIDTTVSVLGRLPARPYWIAVVTCDDATMRAETEETGAGVKRWNHRIAVTPIEGGARLTDRIEIDAGWLTPVYAWWARKLYRHRDAPRRRLLGLGPDAAA